MVCYNHIASFMGFLEADQVWFYRKAEARIKSFKLHILGRPIQSDHQINNVVC
jgi:hypothetical protein